MASLTASSLKITTAPCGPVTRTASSTRVPGDPHDSVLGVDDERDAHPARGRSTFRSTKQVLQLLPARRARAGRSRSPGRRFRTRNGWAPARHRPPPPSRMRRATGPRSRLAASSAVAIHRRARAARASSTRVSARDGQLVAETGSPASRPPATGAPASAVEARAGRHVAPPAGPEGRTAGPVVRRRARASTASTWSKPMNRRGRQASRAPAARRGATAREAAEPRRVDVEFETPSPVRWTSRPHASICSRGQTTPRRRGRWRRLSASTATTPGEKRGRGSGSSSCRTRLRGLPCRGWSRPRGTRDRGSRQAARAPRRAYVSSSGRMTRPARG